MYFFNGVIYFLFYLIKMDLTDGWWVRCDEVFLGKESFHGNKCEWFDSLNFCVKEDSTETLLVRLCIKFPGLHVFSPVECMYHEFFTVNFFEIHRSSSQKLL